MRAALLKVEGVLSADVDFAGGLAWVTYNPSRVKPEQLPEALKGTPFTASLNGPKEETK